MRIKVVAAVVCAGLLLSALGAACSRSPTTTTLLVAPPPSVAPYVAPVLPPETQATETQSLPAVTVTVYATAPPSPDGASLITTTSNTSATTSSAPLDTSALQRPDSGDRFVYVALPFVIGDAPVPPQTNSSNGNTIYIPYDSFIYHWGNNTTEVFGPDGKRILIALDAQSAQIPTPAGVAMAATKILQVPNGSIIGPDEGSTVTTRKVYLNSALILTIITTPDLYTFSHPTFDAAYWKISQAQAISAAAAYVPAEIMQHASIHAGTGASGNYKTGEITFVWQVAFMDISITKAWLGWQPDSQTTLGSQEPYNELIVQFDAQTGVFISREAYLALFIGGPGSSPSTVIPWSPTTTTSTVTIS